MKTLIIICFSFTFLSDFPFHPFSSHDLQAKSIFKKAKKKAKKIKKKVKKKLNKSKEKITKTTKSGFSKSQDVYYNSLLKTFKKSKKECSNYKNPVKNFHEGAGVTDVAFIAFGDTQLGGGSKDQNDLQVKAINSFLGRTIEIRGESHEVKNVRGVIMAGDITQNGRDGRCFEKNEIRKFEEIYGMCGERKLKLPLYEGWGNHDYYEWSNPCYKVFNHPAIRYVRERNKYRPEITNYSRNGHYSFDWDNIHFVQVNLKPSNEKTKNKKNIYDPYNALDFLRNDLDKFVGDSNKGVVIIGHYGLISDWDHDRWWTQEEGDKFLDVVKDYNVISYLHGHAHNTGLYTKNNIPIFNVGSPYYKEYNPDGRGHFTYFHIRNNKLSAIDVSWDPKDPTKLFYGNAWSFNKEVSIP